MSRPTQNNTFQKRGFDAVSRYVDANGAAWNIGVETKAINGRVEIYGMVIWSDAPGHPLTRTILRDLPLDTLFKNVIAAETKSLTRFRKHQKELEPHQGRAHRDKELQVVATVYAMAFNGRLPVQRTVAETLGIPVSTAAKRIMAARRRGLIPAEINKKEK